MQTQTTRLKRKVFDGEVPIFVARPSAVGPYPGVLVTMDAFGVTPWLETAADRLASEGYVVAVPDLYHRFDKRSYAPDEAAAASAAMARTLEGTIVTDTCATLEYMKEPMVCRGRGLGVLGFSFGGRIALQTSCHHIELRAAAICCPLQVANAERDALGMRPIDRAPWIRARLLALYAGSDREVPESERVELEENLRKHNKAHEVVVYPDAGHRFWDEASPDHDASMAKDSWLRITRFFAEELAVR